MTSKSVLVMTQEHHERLLCHLFPGDGLEAAAILLCARGAGPRLRLIVRGVAMVPHAECKREADFLQWPGMAIESAIDMAEQEGLSLILLHSHPGGYFNFSSLDDRSDQRTIPCISQAVGQIHGSAIMVPSGEMRARVYGGDMRCQQIDLVTVAADDIHLWWSDEKFRRRPMAFSSESRHEMNRIKAAFIGASGTGSIAIEQGARLGFGDVLLVDFDKIELKNLNRVLNSGVGDVGLYKVNVLAKAIASHRGEDIAVPIPNSILDRDTVLQVSQADVIFCCVDSKEGRQVVDLISSAFLIPIFDVGVCIPTRQKQGEAAILDVCARIDYVRPGGPTLFDRGVYTLEGLRAEHLQRVAPEQYKKELQDGYIKGAIEEAPSVISLNMRAAADLMLEYIARVYPFRHTSNRNYSRRELSFAAGEEEFIPEQKFEIGNNPLLARGGGEPLLGMPYLSAPPNIASLLQE
ncbi:UBA/THIF-type NAD/FAD binding protein [Herbaspirillum frisingense GSF30]|uniref:UBA/THIF-type NAD/FAD binding protein n=1 Tax=Herbaspirillum frisingense GSF30 TaxID=864073 RepID=A0AAI9IB72_9BURK|nr:ThiF family adenylyltransferase [Herbaspirillum frisingense]EOA02942.1 UBA/THIF-type NAD/FAD binding protein [Herbaspirillum frisingense GSF30]